MTTVGRFVAVVSLLMAGLFSQASAQDPAPHMMPDRMMDVMAQMMQDPVHRAGMMVHAMPEMHEELGLTEEHARSLEQIRSRATQEAAEHMRLANEHRRQLASALMPDPPSSDRIDELTREMAMHRGQAQAAMLAAYAEMHRNLSADQRQRIAEMDPEQMHQHMMHHMPPHEMMRHMHGTGMMDWPADEPDADEPQPDHQH